MPLFHIRKKDEPHKYLTPTGEWGPLAQAGKYVCDAVNSLVTNEHMPEGGEWELQPKRWHAADQITSGAVNVVAIASAIRDAAYECQHEGKDSHKDSAIALMAHHLAHLTGGLKIDRSLGDYGKALAECKDRASEQDSFRVYNRAFWNGDV